ncbi:phosphodiester glycosidase family protein [Gracilimonas tropica]|uniref:phosphodiester glycosidase family protein n=1 Tax=Gracilimonas tropica TaxID=454600 RepID=UPI000372D10A|nr:phosphodiester glycosidase family protein [Gracilimonas tropica]
MKKSILIAICIAFPIITNAQIQYDTLSVKQIGHGIFHYTIEAPSVPWTIDVVEIDITESSTTLETVKAEDSFSGYERTSSMAKRKSTAGHQVVAAVNGDFYGGGTPTNAQVIKGDIMKGPINRDVFGFTREKKMFINPTSYSGNIYVDGDAFEMHGVNRARGTDQLIYYNHFYGSSTGTNQYGTELILYAVDPWVVNGKVRAVVTDTHSGGDAPLTDTTFVLSGHGTSKTVLDAIAIGDTVTIEHQLQPGFDNLKEVVGGRGKFLNDGQNQGDWPERHPRTAVGFNDDSTKVYFMTVDGRKSTSAGMTLTEMGEFMSTFGVTDALNLDGGGSTTMVVHDEVVNSPSDGSGERAVANALMLVSTKEKTGVLNKVQLNPNYLKMYKGSTYAFDAYGSDENYYPMELDSSKINFSLSEGFSGSISADGKYTAGSAADTGYVIMEYEGIGDSSLVIVKGITDFSIFPKYAVSDTSYQFSFFNEAFDFDGQEHNVNNADVEWSVENPEIGAVTNGVFSGLGAGSTKIIGTYDGVSDTAEVDIEIGVGEEVINSFEDAGTWTLSGKNVDLQNSAISTTDSEQTDGDHSLKIDYSFVYENTPDVWLYLNLNEGIPLFGVPDSLILDAKTDGKKHLIEIGLADNDDEGFHIRVKKWAENTSFDIYPALTEDILSNGAYSSFYYPITITQIGIRLASDQETGKEYTGTIYLDNLRITYPARSGDAVSNEEVREIPQKVALEQNYPNPFNPVTQISFSVPKTTDVELTVYDVLGREVTALLDKKVQAGNHSVSFDATGLSTGMYFYQLRADDYTLSKKMMLIK